MQLLIENEHVKKVCKNSPQRKKPAYATGRILAVLCRALCGRNTYAYEFTYITLNCRSCARVQQRPGYKQLCAPSMRRRRRGQRAEPG